MNTDLIVKGKNKKFKKHLHFCGCANLYHYQLGIISFIAENYKNCFDNVYITCSSSGCIATFFLNLHPIINITDFINVVTKNVCQKVNNHYSNSLFNYSYYFWIEFEKFYVEKAKNKFNLFDKISNNCGIFITQKNNNNFIFNPYNYETKIIEKWDDEQDILNCVKASSFIPMYHRNQFTYNYKNTRCLDGCTFDIIPIIESISSNYQKSLNVTYSMFREFSYYELIVISSNFNYHEALYHLGRADAIKNKKIFDDFFIN